MLWASGYAHFCLLLWLLLVSSWDPRWNQVRALLEPSWAKLGLLEGVWGPCWTQASVLGALLGGSWGHLGPKSQSRPTRQKKRPRVNPSCGPLRVFNTRGNGAKEPSNASETRPSGHKARGRMFVYIYIYVYTCIYIYMYTHMCIYPVALLAIPATVRGTVRKNSKSHHYKQQF